jgi:hypothetical protein
LTRLTDRNVLLLHGYSNLLGRYGPWLAGIRAGADPVIREENKWLKNPLTWPISGIKFDQERSLVMPSPRELARRSREILAMANVELKAVRKGAGPTTRLTDEKIAKIIDDLRAAARDLSAIWPVRQFASGTASPKALAAASG